MVAIAIGCRLKTLVRLYILDKKKPFPSPQFWAFSQGIRTVLKASLALQSVNTWLLAWYIESHKWKRPAVHNDAFTIEWLQMNPPWLIYRLTWKCYALLYKTSKFGYTDQIKHRTPIELKPIRIYINPLIPTLIFSIVNTVLIIIIDICLLTYTVFAIPSMITVKIVFRSMLKFSGSLATYRIIPISYSLYTWNPIPIMIFFKCKL